MSAGTDPSTWQSPTDAAESVPPGTWALAVSGGADSVALLRLLHARAAERSDFSLHVVHLDHQTRSGLSAADACFVVELADRLGLPVRVARRDQVEAGMAELAKNRSARFRAARLALFREAIADTGAGGVILAHHADDRAETILLRLLRGSGYSGLAGMLPDAVVSGVRVLRPLLNVRREALHQYLQRIGQPWREDASNRSREYARNRVRAALAGREALTASLCELASRSAALRDWVTSAAPQLPPRFRCEDLARLPSLLAEPAAGRWLREQGIPTDDLSPAVVNRLIRMSADAATPARQQFPGGITVRRRAKEIFADRH